MANALIKKDLAEVHRLLDHGFDPNFLTESGESPLSLFTEAGDYEGMENALRTGADANTIGPGLTEVLNLAASRFDVRAVEILLEAGADPDASRGWDPPPLFSVLAARQSEEDQLKMLKLLIEHGADVDSIVSYDGTALRRAVLDDHPKVVAYLLAHGANPRLRPPDSRDDPLTVATSRGYGPPKRELARMLRDALAKQEPLDIRLLKAVELKDERAVRSCLRERGNPNLHDRHKSPLLHLALKNGDLPSVRLLTQFGANVEAKDAAGRRPLMIAAMRQDVTAAKYLVALGAEIGPRDIARKSALAYSKRGSALSAFLRIVEQTVGIDKVSGP
jgi:ankyrin repeat protein